MTRRGGMRMVRRDLHHDAMMVHIYREPRAVQSFLATHYTVGGVGRTQVLGVYKWASLEVTKYLRYSCTIIVPDGTW